MNYLGNALSLNMIEIGQGVRLLIEPCLPADVPQEITSVIGHQDTAQAASIVLGRSIPYNRQQIILMPGDKLYIFQFVGERLPEGTQVLPDNAEFAIYMVRFEKFDS